MEKEKQNINISPKSIYDKAIYVPKNAAVIEPAIDELRINVATLKTRIKEIENGLNESRKDYLQIFGVFASIITLVGFNATAAQKGIWEIIVGNLTLGLVLIGFIYLLYVVPKRVANDKPFINFPKFESLFEKVILGIFLVILSVVIWVFFDYKTNLGLCNLYPFPKIEIGGKIYCLK